ncbi:MAG: DUF354 domain-containing protein, partial [Gammaproteobacteria bacterium]
KLKGRIGIFLRGVVHLVQSDFRIMLYCLRKRVDIMMGTDVAIAHVGWLLRKVSLVFTDDDIHFIKPYCRLAFPFATSIVAPSTVWLGDWSTKKISYPGTQKTAYIHPRVFNPNPNVLRKYNLHDTRFIIVRSVEFGALHDSIHGALSGISDRVLDEIVAELDYSHNIIISYEGAVRQKYSKYCIKLNPSDMLDLMYYADLLIGDSQSMQVEAALLGTPSIRSNRWVTEGEKVSVIYDLEYKYNLCVGIPPHEEEAIISTALRLSKPGVKDGWRKKTLKFFEENISLTDMLVWLLEDFDVRSKEIANSKSVIDRFIYTQDYKEILG